MQDFYSIPGLADRIFGSGGDGGGGAENRRMRGYPGGCVGAQETPAKCPRCESTNTKFCYYNNYNLSQPRHICKSCRRYWTKGGVLRNVPVGGGCRKSSSSSSSTNSKRSSSSPSKKSSSKDRRRSPAAASRSRSSSDSSSLTASGAASASPVFADPALFAPHNPNGSTDFDPEEEMEPPAMIPGSDIVSETDTFTSLMTAAGAGASAFLGLNFSDPPPPLPQFGVHQPLHHRNGTASHSFETDHEIRMQGVLTSGRIDQAVPIDLLQQQQQQQDQFDGRMCGGGGGMEWPTVAEQLDFSGGVDPGAIDLLQRQQDQFEGRMCGGGGGMEWPTAADQLLFDFGGGVDPGAYWNQSQWSDADLASLYLP